MIELGVDTLIEVWRRTWVSVDAETEEDAVKEYLEGNYEVVDSEILYETEEIVEPTNNSTVEIWDRHYTNMLYENYDISSK